MRLRKLLRELHENPHDKALISELEKAIVSDPRRLGNALERHFRKTPESDVKILHQGFLGKPATGPRQTWENQLKNQVVQPLQYFYPTSMMDPDDKQSILNILTRALNSGVRVKAAGSGHSYSDVATTPDFFINTHGLNATANASKPLTGQLSQEQLRTDLPLIWQEANWQDYDPEKNHALYETEAGITIHDLNKKLWKANLGLLNMGGYDGQTMVGAVSTSTHGSGITLGPFPSMVRSLVLATTGHYNGTKIGSAKPINGISLYRIEPSDGITNPDKYDDPNVLLIQNDQCFESVVTSMGCMGVIYSVVIEVSQNYWLSEVRTKSDWASTMAKLQPNPDNPNSLPDILHNNRHFEFYQSPYPNSDGLYPNIECVRNIVPDPGGIFQRKGHRQFITSLLGKFDISFEILVAFLNAFPAISPFAIEAALDGLVTPNPPYINKSYDIFNLGVNGNAGFASEVSYPIGDPPTYNPAKLFAGVQHIFDTAI
ncbi:MAG: hypothetical protein AAF570_07825, partial [Bacteroidota bacterium]